MDEFNNRILLTPDKIPKKWLNIAPFLPSPPNPLLLPNGMPADFETMCMIFPTECVKQAVSQEEFIEIPKIVREKYSLSSRPTPLHRAFQLEKSLGLDSDKQKIYFKNESVSPTGSHKGNTAIAQAYYAKQDNLVGLTTETGAGQWGSALSMAGAMFNLKIKVFMVRISYQQKPGRVVLINNFGAEIIPSPSDQTESGRMYFNKDSNHTGSLGIAISEAVEASMAGPDYKYTLGSVVDFVCLHQTVVGQEAKIQMEMAGDYPDVVIGCIGGGSNFAGLTFPFAKDKMSGANPDLEIIGAEPMACPSITKGEFAWDFGDSAHKAPIVKMYTLGSSFIPPPVHAGGLRYHGASPLVSILAKHNVMKTVALHQKKIIEAGILFSKTEGILPAPETCHAIAAAIDSAVEAKDENKKRTILFNFSGHGHFDVLAYKAYMDNKLVDYEYPDSAIHKALEDLPKIDESKFM
jgi:tryptophan synthase beta chain